MAVGGVDLTFMQALNLLRTMLPADLPVRVRRTTVGDDFFATCDRRKKTYIIKIDRKLHEQVAIEFLIHEWAHARSWILSGENQCEHDAHWGVAYAECYRVVRDLYIP